MFFLYLFHMCEILGRFVSGLRYPLSFFHPPVFPLLAQLVHCQGLGCCYCFLYRLVCLPLSLSSCLRDVSHIFLVSLLAFITSRTLSFHHHVSLSPAGLRPVVIPNTFWPTFNIVVLVSSHHYCTLFTGRTFSNTFSLNCTLRLSSFNLQ